MELVIWNSNFPYASIQISQWRNVHYHIYAPRDGCFYGEMCGQICDLTHFNPSAMSLTPFGAAKRLWCTCLYRRDCTAAFLSEWSIYMYLETISCSKTCTSTRTYSEKYPGTLANLKYIQVEFFANITTRFFFIRKLGFQLLIKTFLRNRWFY